MPYKFAVNVKERQDKLPTMYWLPILHKRPYKAKCIANCSSCTMTELSILLTSCSTAVKSRVIRYHATVYERSSKNMFWSIKNSAEVLSKLQARSFFATRHDFSIFYTTLPHNLIKDKLLVLIERAFRQFYNNEGMLYLACKDKIKRILGRTDRLCFVIVLRHDLCVYRDDSLTS